MLLKGIKTMDEEENLSDKEERGNMLVLWCHLVDVLVELGGNKEDTRNIQSNKLW